MEVGKMLEESVDIALLFVKLAKIQLLINVNLAILLISIHHQLVQKLLVLVLELKKLLGLLILPLLLHNVLTQVLLQVLNVLMDGVSSQQPMLMILNHIVYHVLMLKTLVNYVHLTLQ